MYYLTNLKYRVLQNTFFFVFCCLKELNEAAPILCIDDNTQFPTVPLDLKDNGVFWLKNISVNISIISYKQKYFCEYLHYFL